MDELREMVAPVQTVSSGLTAILMAGVGDGNTVRIIGSLTTLAGIEQAEPIIIQVIAAPSAGEYTAVVPLEKALPFRCQTNVGDEPASVAETV